MSTIKSSNEHLTLNADGSGKDIKFQSNGSEVASISDGGVVTAAGSTLTGNLQVTSDNIAIGSVAGSGAAGNAKGLTIANSAPFVRLFDNVGSGATLADYELYAFNSAFYVYDNIANAARLNIQSDGKVGIGATPSTLVHVKASSGSVLRVEETGGAYIDIEAGGSTGHIKSKAGNDLTFSTGSTQQLQITSGGRGLSQFTAKVWCNFNGTGTAAIQDSHNVSGLTDNGTGDFTITFSNNMSNTNYCTSIGNYRGLGDTGIGGSNLITVAVGSIRFETIRDGSSTVNPNFCNLLIFGD